MSGAVATPFRRTVELVREMTGLALDAWPESRLHDAVKRAAAQCGLQGAVELIDRVELDSRAREALLSEVTIGETYFLREPKQLEFAVREAIPAIRAKRGSQHRPRLWSAACSTGEEAYSLAILLRQHGLAAEVLGTDLAPARIDAARCGVYRTWSLRTLRPEQIAEFFRRSGDEYLLRPVLRERVRFQVHNLIERPPEREWDVILCRNALMYLDADALRRAAEHLLGALAPDGYLVLGASDPLLSDHVRCEVERTAAGLVYRPPRQGGALFAPPPPRPAPPVHSAPPAPVHPAAPAAPDGGERAAEALRGRDYAGAEALARECVLARPERLTGWVVLVRALANRGRIADAMDACASGLVHHPHSAELLYLRALLLSEDDRADEAAVLARQAVYLDPTLAVAQLLLGSLRLRLGERRGGARALLAAERLLAGLPADAIVPASDGETVARLLAMVRAQLQLIRNSVGAHERG